MNIFRWNPFNGKSEEKAEVLNSYGVGDFILSKRYMKDNKEMGGLVLRVEEQIHNTYRCSLGSFIIKKGELIWVPKKVSYINISLGNIERSFTAEEAEEYLDKIIIRK